MGRQNSGQLCSYDEKVAKCAKPQPDLLQDRALLTALDYKQWGPKSAVPRHSGTMWSQAKSKMKEKQRGMQRASKETGSEKTYHNKYALYWCIVARTVTLNNQTHRPVYMHTGTHACMHTHTHTYTQQQQQIKSLGFRWRWHKQHHPQIKAHHYNVTDTLTLTNLTQSTHRWMPGGANNAHTHTHTDTYIWCFTHA